MLPSITQGGFLLTLLSQLNLLLNLQQEEVQAYDNLISEYKVNVGQMQRQLAQKANLEETFEFERSQTEEELRTLDERHATLNRSYKTAQTELNRSQQRVEDLEKVWPHGDVDYLA